MSANKLGSKPNYEDITAAANVNVAPPSAVGGAIIAPPPAVGGAIIF